MDLIELCRESIAIDSTPLQGNKEIISWAAKQAELRGFFVEIQSEYDGDLEQQNLILRLQQGRPDSEFLFQNHLDTVDPGPYHLWKDTFHNPFEATIKDGKIYGLGSADGKIDFICKLEAIAAFKETQIWKLPPVLVVTYGSQIGMTGALKLIRKNKISAKTALIGEPTGLNIINAAPGYATVEIRVPYSKQELLYRQEHNVRESTSTQSKLFSGKAAPTTMTDQGESAIRKMLESLLQLPENLVIIEIDGGSNPNTVPANAFLELDLSPVEQPISKKLVSLYQFIKNLELEFQTVQDPEFSPAHPTLNIGLIRTHEDHVLILGSCRIPPIVSQKTYEDWMGRMKIHCESISAQFRISDYKKPFRTDEKSMIVRGCLTELKKIKQTAHLESQNTTNEASLFSRVGIDCICFGPGEKKSNLHTPDECVSVEDIPMSIEYYKKVIERFCL